MMLRHLQCWCSHLPPVQRRPGVGILRLTAPATIARHRTATCRKVRLPAAAPAATEAQPSQPTAEAAAAAQQDTESTSRSAEERGTNIRISAGADATKTAVYMVSTLSALDPGAVLRVSAAGPAATLAALRTVAKASELTAERDPSKVLTLQLRTCKVSVEARASSSNSPAADGQEPQQQRDSLSVREFFVRQEPADLYSTETDRRGPPINPLRIRPDTEFSKVADHACRNAKAAPDGSKHPVAAFSILPGGALKQRAAVLVTGLAAARRQLWQAGHPGLTLTVQRTLVERTVQQQDGSTAAAGTDDSAQQQEQQHETESSSSSSEAERAHTYMTPSYLVRVYSTLRRDDDGTARAERRQTASDRRGGDAGGQLGSKGNPGSRAGYVQVPAAEWSALREQLEVVPHLTQQLQTMTRQHEQLLSLLAAQQEAGQGPGAAPEDGQQQQEQQ